MMTLKLIFENPHFAVVSKPAGMNFHSEEGPGLAVQVQQMLNVEQLYPVHRLDKMTSGLVVFAKTLSATQVFQTMFERREIEKFYLAISTRKPKKKQGWIKGDMEPARRGNWKFASTKNNPAVTQFVSTALQTGERGFLIKPHTGKTHQIRVALKSIAAPISGDIRYAHAEEAKKEERGYLHAYALRFTFDGKMYDFVLEPEEGERFLSDIFVSQLAVWSKPWELF
ncbi:MAG: TIGR01621 family pseudouridine synthase [Epsilonproteobacteria bacterium]|nr:MAG: TIGR01621 family pseudouridine synthase [Campylobacterota bacterium]